MSEPYTPLRGRVQAVTVVFVITAVVTAVAVVSDILELALVNDIIAGKEVTDAEATANDNRQAAIGFIQFALFVAGVVVFIRWMYGAYRNVGVVAPAEQRYSPGWAIGGWFVPIMNVFRPKQMVNDIWRAGGRDVADAQPGRLLLGWWLLFLLSSWIGNFAGRAYLNGETAEDLRTGTTLYLISDATTIPCAILAIMIVRRATDRLDFKKAALPPPAPEPEPDMMSPERPTGAPA